VRVQPEEGVSLKIGAKVPGSGFEIRSVNMDLLYGTAFLEEVPDAYQRLLLDLMLGDPTLFIRADETECAWDILDPVIRAWARKGEISFYPAGSWGPEEADELMVRDGRSGGGREGGVVIGESRSAPYGGARSPGQIERELARLRMNEDGSLGARASVLNLIVVTSEESAPEVTRVVCELSGNYPSRAILMVSDPEEGEANLEIGLSAFCSVRHGMPGGSRNQVCAEQITMHVEGPPAEHLESLAGPVLIPDLPVFLWYPDGGAPGSPGCATAWPPWPTGSSSTRARRATARLPCGAWHSS
jgi:hypothetical protein